MSKIVSFNAGGGSKLYNRPKLTRFEGPKNAANYSQPATQERRLALDRRLLRPNYFDLIHDVKISNSEECHSTGSSETRESISFRQKPVNRTISLTTQKLTSKPRKHVTFQDQRNVQLEGYIMENNKKNVTNCPFPVGQHQKNFSAGSKKNIVEKQVVYAVRGVTSIETPNTPAPACNEFANPSEMSSDILFTADMFGFASENIRMYVKGRRLIIEAVEQEKDPVVRTRRTQEVLILPEGVQCDNLKVARNEVGLLLFEHAWKF